MPYNEREEILDVFNAYMLRRMQRDYDGCTIYLHEVADLITLPMNSRRASCLPLAKEFTKVIDYNLQKDFGEMNQDFRNMNLFKISQIIKALPPRRQILQKLFKMAL